MITGTAKTALRHAALLVLGIAAISPAAYADGTISACPTTVTGPGTWTVTQNLTATGTCITIQGNGVAIDLQGHTITALGTGADFGITDSGSCASPPCQQNIIIANGTITGFFIGIGLENTDYATIANMTVIGSRPWGIRLRAHSVITDSQANQGVGGKDAMLFLGDHNTVNNSKANDNLGTGIAFAGNDNTVRLWHLAPSTLSPLLGQGHSSFPSAIVGQGHSSFPSKAPGSTSSSKTVRKPQSSMRSIASPRSRITSATSSNGAQTRNA